MTKEQMISEILKLQQALAALEAAEKESEEQDEEVEDTRPIGEKIGSLLGSTIVGTKTQGTSFWGGLKKELVEGGIIKPSKKRK